MSSAATDHSRVSPHGKKLGAAIAGIAEMTASRLSDQGEADERCKSCAFRLGTVPNGCLQTQMDALKAVVEDVPFLCHQGDRRGSPCHGWYLCGVAMQAADIAGKPPLSIKCDWEFSTADEPPVEAIAP